MSAAAATRPQRRIPGARALACVALAAAVATASSAQRERPRPEEAPSRTAAAAAPPPCETAETMAHNSCLRQMLLQHQPHRWRLNNLTRVQMNVKGTYGKSWFLDFDGGTRFGGVSTAMKLRSHWADVSSGIVVSPPGSGKALPTPVKALPIAAISNCTVWEGKGFGDSEHFHVFNEMLVFHVDRVLGFDTVPPGRLVVIEGDKWIDWFSGWACAPKRTVHYDLMMNAFKNALDFKPHTSRIGVVGWLQLKIEEGLTLRPEAMVDHECGAREPNASTLTRWSRAHGRRYSEMYYKMMLVLRISGRADVSVNCYGVDPRFGSPEWCHADREAWDEDTLRVHARPVNLDNDRIYAPTRVALSMPCQVPRRLRERVLAVDDLGEALRASIGKERVPLGAADQELLQAFLTDAVPFFKLTQRQFRACGADKERIK